MQRLSNQSLLLIAVVAAVFAGAYTLVGHNTTSIKNGATHAGVVEIAEPTQPSGLQHATFAMGCFWHSEEMFLELKGVTDVIPGYCGGSEPSPDYETVSSGTTGYAESVNVTFDPTIITYRQLLEVFFAEHDPTSLNRQGPDSGPQYRSAVFYRNAEQKKQIDEYIATLTSSHKYSSPIVTQVAPFRKFYRAEEYHLRYFRNHPDHSYIRHVTLPEILSFRNRFANLLRKD
ncbi:MAG: peptide-methionine (S)-S-oxide reductase MsrA [Bacteroidetes bacterium]|nr:peptide-methionine (S)-S-oxide reductase MsrA [Bacteroidota bacterium]